jgi:hypothetical protein
MSNAAAVAHIADGYTDANAAVGRTIGALMTVCVAETDFPPATSIPIVTPTPSPAESLREVCSQLPDLFKSLLASQGQGHGTKP